MRIVLALWLVGCASSPPPRPATDVAVGSEPWNHVALGEWSIELPDEALSHVHLTWGSGEQRAELSLSGAAIGASVERLADDEANTMRALNPDVRVERRRTHVAGVVAIGLTQGQRDVVVAMRNPWRTFRLAVAGGAADAWFGDGTRLADIGLAPQWPLQEARFECTEYVLTASREPSRGERVAQHGEWSLWLRIKTEAPDALDRIQQSFGR